MFELYYLADQSGPLDGDKCSQGSFASLEECVAKAAQDGIQHYSVELETEIGATILVVA